MCILSACIHWEKRASERERARARESERERERDWSQNSSQNRKELTSKSEVTADAVGQTGEDPRTTDIWDCVCVMRTHELPTSRVGLFYWWCRSLFLVLWVYFTGVVGLFSWCCRSLLLVLWVSFTGL